MSLALAFPNIKHSKVLQKKKACSVYTGEKVQGILLKSCSAELMESETVGRSFRATAFAYDKMHSRLSQPRALRNTFTY